MKTYTVYVSLGLQGCKRECQIEMEDDSPEEEIQEAALEALWTMVSFSWYQDEKKRKRKRKT